MQNFIEIVEADEFDHYGVRAHRAAASVGHPLGKSRVWVDGECTEEELSGISAICIKTADDIEAAVSRLRREYCWADETIVLVGGYSRELGEDAGEIIIRDNLCLAVL